MTREEIIRLAQEAGIGVDKDAGSFVPVWHLGIEHLERFAALAIQDETVKRKRLRKKCDSLIESLKEMIELWEDDPAYGWAIAEKARNTIADAEGA